MNKPLTFLKNDNIIIIEKGGTHMELTKILSNPVRIKVMQYLQGYGEATTKQISEALSEVPTPTLYRHINALLEEDVLLVKEQRKVRGSLERLLIINEEKFAASTQADIAQTAYQFLMELYKKFHSYSEKQDIDPRRDRLSFRTCVLTLTDDKYDECMKEIATVIEKYEAIREDGKQRSISLISAPIEDL